MPCNHDEYDILKERGRQVTAQCLECHEVFTFVRPKKVPVNVVINRRNQSVKAQAPIEAGSTVNVGDIIEVGEEVCEIHAIECAHQQRKKEAPVGDIRVIWAVSLTQPHVAGLSIHLPDRTDSYKVVLEKDMIFAIGDVVQVGTTAAEISHLMTLSGKRKKAYGDEIKRIYANPSNRVAITLLEVCDGE